MRKIVLAVVFLAFLSISARGMAGAVLNKPHLDNTPAGDVIADDTQWVGHKYAGAPIAADESIVAMNINYISSIDVRAGSVYDGSGKFAQGTTVNIRVAGYGKSPYSLSEKMWAAYTQNKHPGDISLPILTFEDSGIIGSAARFIYGAQSPGIPVDTRVYNYALEPNFYFDAQFYTPNVDASVDILKGIRAWIELNKVPLKDLGMTIINKGDAIQYLFKK